MKYTWPVGGLKSSTFMKVNNLQKFSKVIWDYTMVKVHKQDHVVKDSYCKALP